MSYEANAGRITAVLGPTNTGKTYLAIDRMLGHASGMIGFPLRLLARENYDRIVQLRGKAAVALITGEEKIVPAHARYFVCTVESMPVDRRVEFLAVDEIQLCGDRERGHVFTDRLLHARGERETMFLGSDTVRPLLKRLVPEAEIVSRPRFSRLTYAGVRKLTRLPRRSAVVAFSAQDVYILAEIVRRQRGGAAVVLGALSPRARNAQVAMYQAGEVDYLVATDAIGMGLNMDVDHVAFAEDAKFDGHAPRRLSAAEMAQIAGRAGRHMNDGTFGVTGDCAPFDEEMVEAIEAHSFEPLRHLYWRNHRLGFRSLDDLRRSLEAPTGEPFLIRKRDAEDHLALEALSRMSDVRERANAPSRVRMLWDICQIPDFRKTMTEAHARLLAQIFLALTGGAERLDTDWVASQVKRFDRIDGDIDTLVNRIAHIRTWTYITHRGDWVSDPVHWQATTRAVEDRLSDALHEKLTQRFVDRRTAVIVRKLKDRDKLMAAVRADSRVVVEGHEVGHMEGLEFVPDVEDSANAKPVLTAARRVLPEELARRTGQIETAEDAAFSVSPRGEILWLGAQIGQMEPGHDPLSPQIKVIASEMLETEQRRRIEARVETFFANEMKARLGPLLALKEAALEGPARGIAFQIVEGLGSVAAEAVAQLRRGLDDEQRRALARLDVRFGTETVFLPTLLKPRAVELRAMLWSVFHGTGPADGPPPAGRVMVSRAEDASDAFYLAVGYRRLGGQAIRADMVERFAQLVRQAARNGPFAVTPDMLSLAGVGHEAMAEILKDLGYRRAEDVEGQPRFVARRRHEERKNGEAEESERAPRRRRNRPRPQAKPDGEKAEGQEQPRQQERKRHRRPRPEGAERVEREGRPERKERPRNETYPQRKERNVPIEDSPFAILKQLKFAK